MTIEKLKTTPEFVTLGQQQKAWTEAYCTNGADKLAAAKAAYTAKDDDSYLAIANRNLRHPIIRKLVNDFYGKTDEIGSKPLALAIVWRRINAPGVDDKYLLDYLKLYGLWMGLETAKAPAEPQKSTLPEPDEAAAADILNELNEV